MSTNLEAVKQFGINPENVFPFWDFVGGRYSLWSSIGLSICCSIGKRQFLDFLAGAEAMDHHFEIAPTDQKYAHNYGSAWASGITIILELLPTQYYPMINI